jgi:hypothetical protein
LLACNGTGSSLSQENLLGFLYESTTWTAASANPVFAKVAIDAVLFSHVRSFGGLEAGVTTDIHEAEVCTALFL